MPLKVLPQNISNLIAAGEVVQRPSSVVKELVENSIDAGAENVSVIIEDSGRTLIQVIDDGCGMTAEDARLCFERHATSKISSAEDLNAISTYGFRGEALPSIAAVAEVTLKTRKKGEETGSETVFTDSALVSQEETACPEGTNIAVRNIFYNTPARRKFLKSDATEFRQIVSEFSRVALVRPSIGLRLLHNGKTVFDLKRTPTLKKRILEIEGTGKGKELIDLGVDSSIVKVSGFIGDPKDAHKGAGSQFLFVNGRYFRSPYFNRAILKAYEKLIPDDHTPSYYIYIETDPESLDINIHPTKTEIKFENESAVFEILYAAAKEALGSNAFTPSIDFDMGELPEIPPAPSRSTTFHSPKIDYNPLFDPFDHSERSYGPLSGKKNPPTPDDFSSDSFLSPAEQEMGLVGGYPVLEDKSACGNILAVHGKYIFTTVKSGVMVISVSRARECIFFEQFLSALDNCGTTVQGTLFPVIIDLSPADYAVLMEDGDRLTALGFDIRSFGPSTVVVNGVPDGLPLETDAVKDAIMELVSFFTGEETIELKKADVRRKMALALSRSAAKTGTGILSPEEGQALIDRLFACAEPSRTPDGRKTMNIITLEEIGKLL